MYGRTGPTSMGRLEVGMSFRSRASLCSAQRMTMRCIRETPFRAAPALAQVLPKRDQASPVLTHNPDFELPLIAVIRNGGAELIASYRVRQY